MFSCGQLLVDNSTRKVPTFFCTHPVEGVTAGRQGVADRRRAMVHTTIPKMRTP
jgi:hypothetical protein